MSLKRKSSFRTPLNDDDFDYIEFDQILEKCGDFGRYQIMLLILYGWICVLVPMHYFAQTMIGFVPNHWCYHEKFENKSFREIEKIYKNYEQPSCTKLDIKEDGSMIKSEEPCTRWIYELDYGFKSMSVDLNWVCENEYKTSVGQSLFFVGTVFGTLCYGYLSDKIGRVPALVFSHLSGFIGDFSTIFALELWSFSICRFISGLAADTNIYLMYIIILEYINPKWRTVGLNLMVGVFYCIGLVISPWLAVWTGYWKYFLCCTSIPLVTIIAYYFIVQESAQWLVIQNEVEDAIIRLQRIAKFNRRQVGKENFDEFRQNCEKEQRSRINRKAANVFDTFRTPRLRKHMLILFFDSMVISLGYDVGSRYVEGMGYSPFIIFSISALGVLPASLLIIALQFRIGRKGLTASAMLLTSVIMTSTGILLLYIANEYQSIAIISLVTASRFGVAISFEAGSQYATEIIPTCVRGQGVAAVHVAGFTVLFLVPYIVYLGKIFKPAPAMIMSALYLGGALSCLFLPETLNKTLPKTLEEGEEFGKGESICSFSCCA